MVDNFVFTSRGHAFSGQTASPVYLLLYSLLVLLTPNICLPCTHLCSNTIFITKLL